MGSTGGLRGRRIARAFHRRVLLMGLCVAAGVAAGRSAWTQPVPNLRPTPGVKPGAIGGAPDKGGKRGKADPASAGAPSGADRGGAGASAGKSGPSAGKAGARAGKAGGARARLLELLETSPSAPDVPELQAIGGAVDQELIGIARDPAIVVPVRARAVSALRLTPSPPARAFLMDLVAGKPAVKPARGRADAGAPADETPLLRAAAVALGWMGGISAPDALAPLLTHADPDVRADAALGLGLTRLPKAATLLRARLSSEPDARVRGHITRQLGVLEAVVAPAPTPRAPVPGDGPARPAAPSPTGPTRGGF